MKVILSAAVLLVCTYCFSQNQLHVFNGNSKKSVHNASVYCEDDLLGKTDTAGNLTFRTKCRKIEIYADNFEDKVADVSKSMKVSLQPESDQSGKIDKVILADKSDPRALRILDELNKRYKDNTPQSLDSYEFKSYNKISVDVDKDSISLYQDFLAKRQDSLANSSERKFKQKDKEKKDSLLGEKLIKVTQESQFFLWEKVSEHKFSKKYGDKTTILDSRMSGFPNPIYEALALNISYLNRVPRQIKEENRNMYRYFLNDTIQLEGRKTFVIKFREVSSKQIQNPRKFNGKIYVDAENYALKKLETTSKKQNEGNGTVIWKPINNKWFLESENLRRKMGYSSFETSKTDSLKKDEKQKFKTKKFGNYAYVKNQYFDFKTNETQPASDFKGYSLEVKNSDGSLLDKYRTDSLNARESATYNKIDTLVQQAEIGKKVSLITNLLKGNYRYKMVDFDLTKLLDYNQYEGIRIGVGAKLNEKFSKTFSPDAYVAYGFKDDALKYGLGLDVRLSQQRTSVFRLHYYDDVFAAGRFSKTFWHNYVKLGEMGVDLYNSNFYRSQQFGASYLYDITNSVSAKIGFNKESQKAKFEYGYRNLGNSFENFNTTLSLKYAPKDKNLMTPGGKITYQRGYPVFFLNFEKGIEALGGKLDYNRLDFLGIYQFRTKMGTTQFKLFGGISSGEAPVWKNFEITGQTKGNSNEFFSKFNSPSQLGFATMPSGTFFVDKFASLQVSQTLPFKYKTLGKRFSDLELKYKTVIGGFKNPQDHQFDFRVLDHNYQEAGVMWNNFLGTNFGVGFSYRLGYYQTSNFSDNFGIELKVLSF